MPQRLAGTIKLKPSRLPVSYKVQKEDRMRDAKNVCTIQDRLETRHGISRYNSTALDAAPQSVSFFKTKSGAIKLIAKDGTSLKVVASSGAHTSIKTGLTAGNKHRAVTFNGRHIIACESDGLFAYDGTTFTGLGIAAPTAPSVSASGSGNTLSASDYQVKTTHYSSAYGVESNGSSASSTVTVSAGQQIDVSSIDTTSDNAFVDKTRIYLKDVTANTDWLFWAEIDLATATDTIDADPTSPDTIPVNNAPPIAGGAKHITVFGDSIAYAGNSTYPTEVFISEPFIPDAFSDIASGDRTVGTAGNGPITGLASGHYGETGDNPIPYLAIFKRNSIEIYSEINGTPSVTTASTEIGCVSHDSIQVIDGDVWFMSSVGWSRLHNGKLVRYKDDGISTYDIAHDDLTDIFSREGYTYEIAKSNFSNFFSVYLPNLRHYMTFISEGANTSISKCYNYEMDIQGFRPYDFQVTLTCGTNGEDSSGRDVVYLGGQGGYIYKHSTAETKGTDVDASGSDVAIPAFAQLYWMRHDDLNATCNFGEMPIVAVSQATALDVQFWRNYNLNEPETLSYDLSVNSTGFELDVDQLDIGILGETGERQIAGDVQDVHRTALSLLIGIYKEVQGESMGIIYMQIQYSKNGNPAR